MQNSFYRARKSANKIGLLPFVACDAGPPLFPLPLKHEQINAHSFQYNIMMAFVHTHTHQIDRVITIIPSHPQTAACPYVYVHRIKQARRARDRLSRFEHTKYFCNVCHLSGGTQRKRSRSSVRAPHATRLSVGLARHERRIWVADERARSVCATNC